MFNPSIGGNAKVNGHVPGLAGGRDSKGDQRKRKGRLSGDIQASSSDQHSGLSGVPKRLTAVPHVNSCNGQVKFADRLKGLQGLLLSNGDGYGNRLDKADLNDIEDPYAFNEPEPVRRYSSSSLNMKASTKPASRSIVKKKIEKGNSSSTEPTGLNMTRLYPAFFEPSSPQLTTSTNTSNTNKTTLASLLESSISDDALPKKIDLDRTFSSFSSKDINCFPNLTSPPPLEQTSPSHSATCKVSPVKHGMPSTPQRESNKLAALFSPTYPNSIRNDKTKPRRISTPKTQTREKLSSRGPHCDKKSIKEIPPKPMAATTSDLKKQDDTSRNTINRLQDKIARKMVIGKHQRKLASRAANDAPQRRHSANDLPIMRERSLLEEQLLGHKPSKSLKKDDVALHGDLIPPPTATTQVPGMNGPLTYGIAKTTPILSRSSGNSNRQQKPHATYSSPKLGKAPLNLLSPRQTPSIYGPSKTNTLLRHAINGSPTSMTHVHIKNEINRPYKRPRIKLDVTGDVLKHESLQRLHIKKEPKHDVFSRVNVADTDSGDSDLEEGLVYQKHWFSGWTEAGSGLASEERREGRLSQLRAELRRKLSQVWGARRDPAASPLPKCVINAALTKPSQTALLLSPIHRLHRTGRSKLSMLVPKQCVYGKQGEGDDCNAPALPCAHHCVRHITYNVEQLLFEHCTAKFSDNTQCCVPVFDSSHELPLCSEHARKLDDYNRLSQVLKPKRVRKKSKPSAMTRSTKRNKKKKQKPSQTSKASPLLASSPIPVLSETLPPIQAQARLQRSRSLPTESLPQQDAAEHTVEGNLALETASSSTNSSEIYVTDETFAKLNEPELSAPGLNGATEAIVDVSGVDVEEDALEFAAGLTVSGDLGQQEAALLEEHDLTNVLNEIPSIAFTDLFGEDKNPEPTREETEELERALAAVDKDVKSLQNMGSQILLDYKAQGLMQASQAQAQAQVFLEVDKLSPSPGLLDIEKLQAQGLFDEKNAQGLLDNFLDDQALVQTLTSQLPSDLPGNNTGLVYYHNGFTVNGSGMDKNLCVASSSSASIYQTPGMVGVPLPTQTDLHS